MTDTTEATTQTEETAGQGTAAPAPEQTPGSGSGAFHEGIKDEALRGWVQAKGWSDAEGMARSAHNLEKLAGWPEDQVLRLPKEGDAEGLRQVLSRLGMPSEPKDYKIDVPEGLPVDDGFLAGAREAFHKAGLTSQQAEQVAGWWNETMTNQVQLSTDEYNAQLGEQEAALKKEWGKGYTQQLAMAQRAAQGLGVDPEVVDKMESAIGYSETMKLFAGIGKFLGEDRFVSGDGGGGGGFNASMTPAEAQAALARFTTDDGKMSAFLDRDHPQHKVVREERSRLYKLAYPD